jgi:predicted acetyltransferase
VSGGILVSIIDFENTKIIWRSFMSSIKKLTKVEISEVSKLWTNAYPGDGVSQEAIEGRKEFAAVIIDHLPEHDLYAFTKENKVLGAMCLVDYKMNLHGTKAAIGGIRAVAVDLLHKKENVCRELMTFTCKHFTERDACMLALYPFRPDFYKKMGFGFGTVLTQYRVKPEFVQNHLSKEHLVYLDRNDSQIITECYNEFLESNHGMFVKTGPEYHRLFLDDRRIVGYKEDGKILGYINFSFKSEQIYKNSLVIHEFIYNDVKALHELCTFLHTQKDQFERIIFDTQDEHFHYLFDNPSNGLYNSFNSEYNEFCVSAVGMMYRIINVKRFFQVLLAYNWNNQTCKLKINIIDSFYKPNNGSVNVNFSNGISTISNETNDFDVEITLGIAEFSLLAMGAVKTAWDMLIVHARFLANVSISAANRIHHLT